MLRNQLTRHVFAERFEEFRLRFEFLFPLVGLDREKFAHGFARGVVELGEIEILRAWDETNLGFCGAAVTFAQGDTLALVGPASPDATFVNFSASLVAYET